MANLLQKIVVLLPVVALLAPAATFSHKIHLQQKLSCAVCHSVASTSVKAEDNLLPQPAVCAGCHQDTRSIKAPRQLTVSKFNHSLHVKLGNVAPLIAKSIDSGAYLGKASEVNRADLNTTNVCQACHRGLEQSNEVSLANFPKMADCLVCHTQVDPPFTCGQCHAESPALKPASHTKDWLDTHSRKSTPKDLTSCAVCHNRKFTCLGCH